MQRRALLKAGVASAAVLAAPMIRAQTLPAGPIRIVVGFPPGGGTDALARVLAQKLQTMWGVSIIIDNKAGAAGVIAADYVSKQNPDGNTLLMAHINSHALAPSLQAKLNYNAERDFTPIVLVGVTPNLLICNETQPAKTVKDLVNYCKQNPGRVSFASAGGGSWSSMRTSRVVSTPLVTATRYSLVLRSKILPSASRVSKTVRRRQTCARPACNSGMDLSRSTSPLTMSSTDGLSSEMLAAQTVIQRLRIKIE